MTAGRRGWGLRGITPLIDLLFLLLFGLLALSESRRTTSAETVRVRLPKVEPGNDAGDPDRRTVVLEIDHRSDVRLLGSEAVLRGPAELDSALGAVLGESLPEEVAVEIRGDDAARHGVIVPLLQHLRQRGFGAVHLLALGDAKANWGDPR